jgi:endonuclease/exonuclease/phosphatase (EEP) superfamily protein YafD
VDSIERRPGAQRKAEALRLIRRLARVAVVLFLTSVVTLVAGYWAGPERFWLFSLAQYAPYPVYLLPSLAVLGLSLSLGWGYRFAAVMGLVLVMTSITGFEFNRGEPGAGRVRVMTYNIKEYVRARQGREIAEISLEVARHDPDIVVYQDARQVAGDGDPGGVLSTLGDRPRFALGQYVVASRFPVRDCGRRDVLVRQRVHTYLTCVVTAYGTEFDLFNVHLISPRSGLAAVRADPLGAIGEWQENVADRVAQAEKLAGDVRSSRRPVIVVGDFNAPGTSLVVRRLTGTGLRDAFATAGLGYGHTWGHSLRFGFSFLRIDHILVGPEFAVAGSFVGGAKGSEHRPVIADIYLQRERR